MALDKCLQKRACIQVLNFAAKKKEIENLNIEENVKIEVDVSWLAVLKLTEGLQNKGEVLFTYENSQR